MAIENNYEEWKEIRSRADSIATAVFLLTGGALSLSINVMVGNKSKLELSAPLIENITLAWYFLLTAIICFLLIKAYLIGIAMTRQFKPQLINKHLFKINIVSWALGLVAFGSFVYGMYKMVHAAVLTIGG